MEKNESEAAEGATKGSHSSMEDDEAKKIVESLTDSITKEASASGVAGAAGGAAGASGGAGKMREMEESTKDIVRKAAQAVGSLKETEFDIR
jgi:protein TIF31